MVTPASDVSTLRIEIDGGWSVLDMSNYLRLFQGIYLAELFTPVLEQAINLHLPGAVLSYQQQRPQSSRTLMAAWDLMDLALTGQISIREFRELASTPLYYTKFNFDTYGRDLSDPFLRFADSVEAGTEFAVKKVRFSSPGLTDFTGLGAIVGHIKDLIIYWLERKGKQRKSSREKRKEQLEIEEKSEQVKALRLANLERLLKLDREYHLSGNVPDKVEARLDMKDHHLTKLLEQGKITNALLLPPNDKGGKAG